MSKNYRVLIADDDETLCYLLKEELINEGYSVDAVYDGKFAIENLKQNNYDLLLLDLEMREVMGEDVLRFVKDNKPNLQVVVLTAKSEIRTAIECIKLGAYDFLTKPYEFEELLLTINRAIERKDLLLKAALLENQLEKKQNNKIIGESREIDRAVNLALKAAKADSNVLLEGETGTGKELFAEFIHKNSERRDNPFVIVNCASLPDQLIESELFGHEKGAFTDAKSSKPGLVEIADGGTLFLDEIGELSIMLQPKLLRFLENGEYRRVGGVNNLKSNVRVIGATNKNLMEESEKKNFRRDLLFRLNVITVNIPPLRERNGDVLLLANHFLKIKSKANQIKRFSNAAEKVLLSYSFPGNVRELLHIVERSIIFSDGEEILPQDLNLNENYNSYVSNNNNGFSGEEEEAEIITLEDLEKIHIRKILNQNDWNRENSARSLGISQKTLYTKILKYNLQRV